jgi:hypothetical protein
MGQQIKQPQLDVTKKNWVKIVCTSCKDHVRVFLKNFMSMVCNPNIRAYYGAFEDQDDIWMKDKIVRALSFLSQISQNTPGLY